MSSIRTADQIHDEGWKRFRRGQHSGLEYREHCRNLYQAIRSELEATGTCAFLETLRKDISDPRKPFERDYVIDARQITEYLAVLYAYMAINENDAGSVDHYLDGWYASENGLTWKSLPEIRSSITLSHYVKIIDSLLAHAAEDYQRRNRATHTITIQGGGDDPQRDESRRTDEGKSVSPAPDAGEETARLLEEARRKNEEADRKLRDAEQLLEKIRLEADRRGSLEEDLRTLRTENDQAESLLENARAAAGKITGDATAKAEEIRKAADDYYEEQYGKAQEAVREISANAASEAREKASALVRRYLRGEIAAQTDPETVFPTDEARLVRLSKDAAVEGAYQMERDLRDRLDDFKHQLQEQLSDWRRNLYGQEYGPLADFYQTLFRQLGSGSKTVQAIASQIDRISSSEGASEQDQDLLRRLKNLQKELASLVEQLGKVMGGLGLEILLPEKGEPFDRDYHVDEEAESGSEPVDGVIETVRFPAVCGRDSAGYRILIRPAAVTVKAIETEEHDQ